MLKKIVYWAQVDLPIFKNIKTKEKIFPNKKTLNIENYKSITKYLDRIKPKYLIHATALSNQ